MWIDNLVLEKHSRPLFITTWVPDNRVVILGSGNKSDREVNTKFCQREGIPILKRSGGGGTVVLYPGCVIIGVGTWVRNPFGNDRYFRILNEGVVSSLVEGMGEDIGFGLNGISDITLGEKKVAGTSMFRSKNYLLYQASLIVDIDCELIERTLQYPSREPSYRAGRSHSDFVTGICKYKEISAQKICEFLQVNLQVNVEKALGDELVEPDPHQYKNIVRRMQYNQSSY